MNILRMEHNKEEQDFLSSNNILKTKITHDSKIKDRCTTLCPISVSEGGSVMVGSLSCTVDCDHFIKRKGDYVFCRKVIKV